MIKVNDSNTITYEQMNLINKLRTLMMEFVMWSRAFITSVASGFGDVEAVGLRLYQLPVDIGNVFEVFFGQEIGSRTERFLTDQLLLGAEILRAQIRGDTEAVDANTLKLYQNGDEMAAFLAQINPYWDQQTWSDLFAQFLRTKIAETLAIGAGAFQESVTVSENLRDQALNMADYMAEGIIRNFY